MDKVALALTLAVVAVRVRRASLAQRQRQRKAASCVECKTAGSDINGGDLTQADGPKPQIKIEYCLRCKWGLRASWMAQEVLSTFDRDIEAVVLVPSMEGGTLKVTIAQDGKETVVFDRKVNPEGFTPKDIKKSIRNVAFPERELGKCLEGKKKESSQ